MPPPIANASRRRVLAWVTHALKDEERNQGKRTSCPIVPYCQPQRGEDQRRKEDHNSPAIFLIRVAGKKHTNGHNKKTRHRNVDPDCAQDANNRRGHTYNEKYRQDTVSISLRSPTKD